MASRVGFDEHAQNGRGVARAARRPSEFLHCLAARLCALVLVFAVYPMAAELVPPADFSQTPETLKIVSKCLPRMPWTVAGEHGALFGRQSGEFEAWLWPVKILSHFKIRAELDHYPVPIDVNALAAEIKVTPAETVITYSH